MQIILIRHGKTTWNLQRRLQGRVDIPLCDAGIRELQDRRIPDDWRPERVFTSPLSRARMTAAFLGLGHAAMDGRLVEMNFGDWEGQTYAELHAANPRKLAELEAAGLDMQPPGGETPREALARFMDFVHDQARTGHQRIAIISHKGLMRAALARAAGWDMTGKPPFTIDWSKAQILRLRDEKLEIDRLNLSLETTCPAES